MIKNEATKEALREQIATLQDKKRKIEEAINELTGVLNDDPLLAGLNPAEPLTWDNPKPNGLIPLPHGWDYHGKNAALVRLAWDAVNRHATVSDADLCKIFRRHGHKISQAEIRNAISELLGKNKHRRPQLVDYVKKQIGNNVYTAMDSDGSPF